MGNLATNEVHPHQREITLQIIRKIEKELKNMEFTQEQLGKEDKK